MDVSVTKKISTQLSALLPPSATELPISQTTQVLKKCLFKNYCFGNSIVSLIQIAALTSLGLLYLGTGHRHMAEVRINISGFAYLEIWGLFSFKGNCNSYYPCKKILQVWWFPTPVNAF